MKEKCSGNRIRHSMAFLILFFAVCCTSLICGGQKAKAATEGFWEYQDVTGGVRITKYTGDVPVVEIPSSLGGKPVVALGDAAFRQKQNMHTVKIPSSVWAIADGWYGCFNDCKSLVAVEGLENVTYIGNKAFKGCSSLTNPTFGSALTYIGSSAFYDTNLSGSLSFSASLETIGDNAFTNCINITSVTVPAKVTVLGTEAFLNCTGITSANIQGACGIGVNAFRNCTSLRSVTTSDLVTSIRQGAFDGDAALEEISLGNGIQFIGSNDWGNGAFNGCTSLKTIDIPESVRYIYPNAFNGCTALESVSLHFGLLEIGNNAFDGCSALKMADLPNSVIYLGSHAFHNCYSLTAITMPNSVIDIADGWYPVFTGCEHVEIRGYAGSKAEEYAGSKDNLTFTALTAVPSTDFVFSADTIEMKKGELRRLAYTMTPADTTDAVIWSTSNSNMVPVNQLGEVYAQNSGTVTISIKTTSGLERYMTVVVANDPTKVAFDSTTTQTITIGQTYTRTAKVWENSILRTDIPVTYESANSSIATVDQNGTVRGVKEGTVRITARAQGTGFNLTASYNVKVVNASTNNSNTNNSNTNNGNTNNGSGNSGGTTVSKSISTLNITRSGKTLKVKTIAGATVKVTAKKSLLGKKSKTATSNSKGVAKIKFKKKIKNVTVTVQVSKSGYLTKTTKKKFKK